MLMFSVIIPVYNRESMVSVTLGSVLEQTFKDFEVITVDDGSTDRSVDVLRGYGDRIRVFEQANAGPSAARNLGLTEARGKYVAFLDSDDVWFPWTLQIYADAIRQNGQPSIQVGCQFPFTDTGMLRDVEQANVRVLKFADYLASCEHWWWRGVSSFVIETQTLRSAGGFDLNFPNGEDADLMLRLGEARGFNVLRAPVTFGYRMHEMNLTNQLNRNLTFATAMLDRERMGQYPGGRLRRAQRRKIISRHLRPITFGAIRSGRGDAAWRLYRKMFHWHLHPKRWRYHLGLPYVALKCRLCS